MTKKNLTNETLVNESELRRFLGNQSTYEKLTRRFEPELEMERADPITTHCARIYFNRGFALKVKLPVDYSYLNMETLSDRKKYLLRELELNQSHLPDIYLTVVPIVVNNGELDFNFEDSGNNQGKKIVEWCLIMRRFKEEHVLDNIAQNGDLTHSIAKDLGHSIADYHHSLPSVDVEDGDLRIREIIDELKAELTELKDVFTAGEVQHFCDTGYQSYEALKPLLKQRGKNGYIKRCHGDLHLRNLLMYKGKPEPFDALEFNERFSTIDTMYDLAFTLMDLGHRNLYEQQNIVLNEYCLRSSPDNTNSLAALPLFLYCRAGIRAMTTAQQCIGKTDHNEALLEEGRDYLRRAVAYIEKPRGAMVIAVGGFSGSGKSTIAAHLPTQICPPPGALLIRSDRERKTEFGVSETTDLGASHYTQVNSRRVYKRVTEKVEHAINADYPVIVDATFTGKEQRDEIRRIADSHGVPFYGFWLMAPVSVMRSRIHKRTNDASDAGIDVLDKQLRKRKGHIDWVPIDTSVEVSSSLQAVLDRIPASKQLESEAMLCLTD